MSSKPSNMPMSHLRDGGIEVWYLQYKVTNLSPSGPDHFPIGAGAGSDQVIFRP
jgi:hypothetical protein